VLNSLVRKVYILLSRLVHLSNTLTKRFDTLALANLVLANLASAHLALANLALAN
jgi:hypothetical protein